MSEYLDTISAVLGSSYSREDRAMEVWQTAKDMDNLLDSGVAGGIKRAFRQWVLGKKWLYEEAWVERPWRRTLPETVMQPRDTDRPRGVDDNGRTLDKWRQHGYKKRVESAVLHMRNGWDEREAAIFVCALDELDEALERASQMRLDFTPDQPVQAPADDFPPEFGPATASDEETPDGWWDR